MVISRTFGGSFPVAIPDETTAQQRKRPTESRVLRDESFLVNFPRSCVGEVPSYCVDRFAKHILKGGCIERQPRVAGRRACAGSPRTPMPDTPGRSTSRKTVSSCEREGGAWLAVGDITKDYNPVREAVGAICRWYGRLPPRRGGRGGAKPSISCIICLHSVRSTGRLAYSWRKRWQPRYI